MIANWASSDAESKMQVEINRGIAVQQSLNLKSDISYDLSSNVIFQNLLDNPDVAKFVDQEPDGSFDWTWTPEDGPTDGPQSIARWLILSSNGEFKPETTTSPVYMQSDLDLFKKITGYNLIVAANGGTTVCNDEGGGYLTQAEQDHISLARDMIDSIAAARSDGSIDSGAVSLDDVQSILNHFGGADGSTIEAQRLLIEELMKALDATEEEIQQLRPIRLVDENGTEYTNWSVSREIDSTSTTDQFTQEIMQFLNAADPAELSSADTI